jgi:hypothetical protein
MKLGMCGLKGLEGVPILVNLAGRLRTMLLVNIAYKSGKQMGKQPHYYFSWIVSFQKQRKMRDAFSGDRTKGISYVQ